MLNCDIFITGLPNLFRDAVEHPHGGFGDVVNATFKDFKTVCDDRLKSVVWLSSSLKTYFTLTRTSQCVLFEFINIDIKNAG